MKVKSNVKAGLKITAASASQVQVIAASAAAVEIEL
jgi:hypothetical protein